MKKSIFLFAIILLQSFVAYQKNSVSLKEAENMGKAKVVFTSTTIQRVGFPTESIRYAENIISAEDAYYIVNGKGNIPIDTASIQSIHLKDVKKSKRQTKALWIAGPIVAFGVGFLLLAIAIGNAY